MTFRLRSRKLVALTGILAITGIGGGVAYAYPPGTDLTVAATASALDGDGNSSVTVTVSDVNPTCSTQIRIDGAVVATLSPGQSTAVVTIEGSPGRHRVRARNINCASGDDERARGDFTILSAASITLDDATVRVNKNARFELSGLAPIGATVTVTAMRVGGGTAITPDADIINRRGEAKVKFKFPQTGTFALTATINGTVVATTSVTVPTP